MIYTLMWKNVPNVWFCQRKLTTSRSKCSCTYICCISCCRRRNPCKECVGRRDLWKKHLTRGSQPFWSNCDLSKWETSYWELAKVFMAGGQPATATGPNSTDPIGIFNLIMQCDLFDPSISNRQCVSDVSKYIILMYVIL